jgi:putative oxidoreductase
VSPIRRLARPLLAATFVADGVDALHNPGPRVGMVQEAGLPEPDKVVQATAATKVAGGLMLATGRLSRLSSLALAGATAGYAFVHHPFWKESEPGRKGEQRDQFLRDLGLLGGLLISAADTGGRESVPHAAARISRRTRRKAAKSTARAQKRADKATKGARKSLPVG